jgi:hypothetical protein
LAQGIQGENLAMTIHQARQELERLETHLLISRWHFHRFDSRRL